MQFEHDTSNEKEGSGETASTPESAPEQLDPVEALTAGGSPTPSPSMTLQKAIDLGEYDLEFLSGFPEFHNLSPHSQLQLLRKAMDNRERQLDVQWAEINNVIDFSQKPELLKALRNIENQHKKLAADREKVYIEYSEKL